MIRLHHRIFLINFCNKVIASGEILWASLFRTCDLKLYNGCGEVVETWVWQDAWIQTVNFQELDMTNSNLVMCDITLRFARAYVKY